MAKRFIIKEGDDILRKRAREVKVFDSRLATLLDDLWETMYVSDGVGLAAPQVAVLKRVAVVDTADGNKVELVNPVIFEQDGEQIDFEGCLSIPDFNGLVARPQHIRVRAFDRAGKPFEFEATDYFARAICHETDHLNGILFRDKVEPESDFVEDSEQHFSRKAK